MNAEETEHPLTYLPLARLDLSRDALFPNEQPSPSGENKKQYQALWSEFCSEVDVIGNATSDLASYLESLLHLLRRYTWAIPSAYYYAQPDVSLYEHLHTTAALSACFQLQWGESGEGEVDSLLEEIRDKRTDEWPTEPPVAGLLAGDISGIQSFIYGIHSPKKATAVLRARSFYIQMLSEAAARFVLRELELPITNALYIGGGTFTLIIPPLPAGDLERLSRKLNDNLLRAHNGDLYLALGYAPMALRDFGKGALSRIWNKELPNALDQKKNHRFSELDEKSLQDLFSPQGTGGGEGGTCSICGREAEELKSDSEEEDVLWCPSCEAFRKLGDDLREARYLRISETAPIPIPEKSDPTWVDVLRAFGIEIGLGKSEPFLLDTVTRSVLLALNNEVELKPAANTAVGYRFLVNVVPKRREGEQLPNAELEQEIRPEQTKHFGALASQSKGASYLGILRMDMDNLGKIFSRGLGDYDSFSRRATLSLLLSVFFEGWVGKIATDLSKEKERLYSVYSGGDDLFFVGSWDATVELARRIRWDLQQFTSRPDLGISGALILVHEKYPLYLAAREAATAEESAKKLRNKKDAFCFLKTPLPWERFGYDGSNNTATEWKKAFVNLIEGDKAARSILRVLQDLYAEYNQGLKMGRGPIGPWIWHAAYWFARARERNKRNEGFVRLVGEIEQLLAGQDFVENIEWLALAARWAELATRKEVLYA